ncbi:AAA family ATPase [Lysinibacillus xylanilyticus]|uniref:AAA family ATPase n=1 Tax=Lysinibacillus xylanilyticus TaxID=582475 RepID=UPI0036D78682
MDIVNEIEELKRGMVISENNLIEVFKCGIRGGMRRSLKTNSLVLLSYQNVPPYRTARKENGIWKYTGMGKIGDQSLDYMQNKNLLYSIEKGINVYLFIVDQKEYKFVDQVFLAGKPVVEIQEDEFGEKRNALVFPLIEVGEKIEALEFLYSQPKHYLENINVLEFPQYSLSLHSVDPLAELMIENDIDTITGPGGWFFTKTKFFNNPNTKSKYKSGFIDEITDGDRLVSKGIVFEGQNKFINPFYKSTAFLRKEPLQGKQDNVISGFLIHEVQYKYPNADWMKVKFLEEKILYINERINPFVSLIIGPNGTGKSTVLGNIQKIFLDAFNYSNSRETHHISKEVEYKVIYQMGSDIFQINHQKDNNHKDYYKNNKLVPSYEMSVPKKVIAVAFSINDRFTFNQQSNDSNDRYSYLGIKSSDNIAKIGETTRNLVLNILLSSQKDNFNQNLKFITDFIDVEPIFKIKYTLKKGTLEEVINEKNIVRLQNKLRNQPKREQENINFIEGKDIIEFYSNLIDGKYDQEIFNVKQKSISIDFDFSTNEEYYQYYDEFYILWHLYELGIFNELTVYLKKGSFYKLENASSGEAQYVTTLINIISNIENDSLVIIDEPETSLHPNWQYKYIYGIREIFKKYSSCHFVMATHSHFFIADLVPESSSITSIRKGDGHDIISELHDEKTFGWSPDDILYNIFNMKTSRNFYLEEDLRKLLSYISSGETEYISEIESIFDKLEQLTLRPNDPLKKVIESARSNFENA